MESLGKLGIDLWSFVLYAVNFGVIVFLIAKYFTKPLLKVIDDRRKQIEDNISEAQQLRDELAKQREKMQKENEALKEQVAEEMKQLHADIDAKRKKAEEEIEGRKAKMLEEIQKVMDEEKSRLQGAVRQEVVALVEKMVLHIVHNKVPKEVIEQSTADAWETFKK